MTYRKLFRLYEVLQPFLKYSLPLEAKLPGEKALVIAPHQDDEAIGCGGAVIKHTCAGKEAGVIYCTRESETRDREAALARQKLGISYEISLGYPVESLKGQRSFPGRLREILEDRRPEIVFLPFLLDNHVDHRAVNQALMRAADKKAFGFLVYAYPVWFPLHPNLLIDIGPEWERKKEAISCYASQTATRDYVRMSYSLGNYWAAIKGRGLQVVESFWRASFSEYVSLARKIFKQGKILNEP